MSVELFSGPGGSPTPGVVPPEVRLTRLTKRFGDLVAVDDVSLDVQPGEFFALLGPSGCGKTTTLRMIGGFETPTQGRIELCGRDITADPPERRPVNMVFQSYALFPHLCVFDNVAFGLRRRHAPEPEIRRRTAAALELVRLTGYDRRPPGELSGGQQQRVALARALVCEPRVLLLDEPLGALDLKLRRQLQVELKGIQVEVGITFIHVTHDQEEALALSDRIAVMNHGRVEQLGTPEELYDRPASRFVADFIGTTNLLAGEVAGLRDGIALVRLATGDLGAAPAAGLRVGQRVELAVRPEAVRLEADPAAERVAIGVAAAADTDLRAHVRQSAYLGTSISYQVRTDAGLVLAAVAPRAAERLGLGRAVLVRWDPADALVLGAPSTTEEERR